MKKILIISGIIVLIAFLGFQAHRVMLLEESIAKIEHEKDNCKVLAAGQIIKLDTHIAEWNKAKKKLQMVIPALRK